MRWTRIVTAFAVITSLTNCGGPAEWFKIRRNRTDYRSAQQSPAPAPKLSCATESDTSIASGINARHAEVTIERDLQRVVRKDCKGWQYSDKTETVSSPNVSFEIETAQTGGTLSADVTNRTTCNSVTRSASRGRIKLTIDTSPTLFYLHVDKDRENYLDYQVTLCSDAGKCDGAVIEKGTVILKVNYVEKTLADIREVIDTCIDRHGPQ